MWIGCVFPACNHACFAPWSFKRSHLEIPALQPQKRPASCFLTPLSASEKASYTAFGAGPQLWKSYHEASTPGKWQSARSGHGPQWPQEGHCWIEGLGFLVRFRVEGLGFWGFGLKLFGNSVLFFVSAWVCGCVAGFLTSSSIVQYPLLEPLGFHGLVLL